MFGWAVTGSLPYADSSTVTCLKIAAAEEHLDNLLQQFWEQESVPGDQSCLQQTKGLCNFSVSLLSEIMKAGTT